MITHERAREIALKSGTTAWDGEEMQELLDYVGQQEADEKRLDDWSWIQQTSGVENEKDLWFFYRHHKVQSAALEVEVLRLKTELARLTVGRLTK